MTRRSLISSVPAMAAAAAADSAKRLPVKKGVLVSMLPKELSMKDKFQLAKDSGFDAVEGQTVEDPAIETEMAKASQATGVPIHSVMNMLHWQFPLSSSDNEAVTKSMGGMETSIRNAAAWGANTVLLVPGVVNPATGYADAYKRSQAQIRKLIPSAEKNKVVIAVENVWNKFLLSPMPGLLASVAVHEGQDVKAGEALAVVEAMKMENVLRAARDGTIKVLHAKAGDSLRVDQKILEFA